VDGIVNTLCQLLDHLNLRGHSSLLFAPGGGPDSYAATTVIGLEAAAFPLYPELRLVSPFVNIQKVLDDYRPDLIHVINPITLGLAGLRYAQHLNLNRNRKLPLIASFHTDLPGFAERWGLGFLSPALWSLILTVHNQADLNLAPSDITRQELAARGMRNVKVWSRGVDSNLFSPSRRSAGWRRHLSKGREGAPLLISVGRLSAEKRIHWLCKLLEAYPGVNLAVVGDGPQRSELEQRFLPYRERVLFTGFLYGENLANAYASADLFIFTGANETFGNVVLEAMASGLPVIAPDSGGVLDVMRHGENGMLFHSEQIESLVTQTGRILEDPLLAANCSVGARRSAEMRSWSATLDVLLEEYSRLVASPYSVFHRGTSRSNAMNASKQTCDARLEHIYDRQPPVF
jgi:glycosyltransferase involved in cell wall biosynthesis